MSYEEAKNILNRVLIATQKFRSIAAENSWDESLFPWIFGNKSIVQALIILTEREFTKQEFYNIMYVINAFAPEILICDLELPSTEISLGNLAW